MMNKIERSDKRALGLGKSSKISAGGQFSNNRSFLLLATGNCLMKTVFQIQRAAVWPPPDLIFRDRKWLNRLDVLGLPALGAFDHVELNLLTFLQAAESICLDRGEVYEDILSILAADESITLRVVKPLYCSCFHGVALFPLLF
jgi:hypothetical protein